MLRRHKAWQSTAMVSLIISSFPSFLHLMRHLPFFAIRYSGGGSAKAVAVLHSFLRSRWNDAKKI